MSARTDPSLALITPAPSPFLPVAIGAATGASAYALLAALPPSCGLSAAAARGAAAAARSAAGGAARAAVTCAL